MLIFCVFVSTRSAALLNRLRLNRGNFDQRGATATEYAILVGFIAVVIAGGVGVFGTSLGDYFVTLTADVAAALKP